MCDTRVAAIRPPRPLPTMTSGSYLAIFCTRPLQSLWKTSQETGRIPTFSLYGYSLYLLSCSTMFPIKKCYCTILEATRLFACRARGMDYAGLNWVTRFTSFTHRIRAFCYSIPEITPAWFSSPAEYKNLSPADLPEIALPSGESGEIKLIPEI